MWLPEAVGLEPNTRTRCERCGSPAASYLRNFGCKERNGSSQESPRARCSWRSGWQLYVNTCFLYVAKAHVA